MKTNITLTKLDKLIHHQAMPISFLSAENFCFLKFILYLLQITHKVLYNIPV